jgi:hypothetical protein
VRIRSSIGLRAIEFEIGGKPATELPQFSEQLSSIGPLLYFERARACHVDLDFVALLQGQRLDDLGGKADGKAIPPFGDSHGSSSDDEMNATAVCPSPLSRHFARCAPCASVN